ncbi:hydrolase [Streptomyces sp. WAC 06783]|uniref:HAD family hydrolase n=1 Tax=Streptomyces sp. WAC 06783 TaxID=2203211 RepID=UPI000F74A39B|nr:HAD family hydrolase [Streptomyces sp. WAC 06783]RSO09410.1 hydrolase [Streptomyces sp. WAC 06783]
MVTTSAQQDPFALSHGATAHRSALITAETRPSPLIRYHALIVGIEGVVTDTARIHAGAWQRTFDTFFRRAEHLPRHITRPFDPDGDFRRFFQGRARADGVQAFLSARGIPPPEDEGTWASASRTVRTLVAQEDRLFDAYMQRHGVPVWPDSLRLVGAMRRHAVPVAAVSASRRAHALLAAAGVQHRFDTVVDGRDRARPRHSAGPDPALLREAVRRLRATPLRTAVVVAAPAWVTAARRCGFGLVVGLDREDRAEYAGELYERGAGHVVGGLAELIPAT